MADSAGFRIDDSIGCEVTETFQPDAVPCYLWPKESEYSMLACLSATVRVAGHWPALVGSIRETNH